MSTAMNRAELEQPHAKRKVRKATKKPSAKPIPNSSAPIQLELPLVVRT